MPLAPGRTTLLVYFNRCSTFKYVYNKYASLRLHRMRYFWDNLLCPIDSFANKSDVVTFIKFSESFAVGSFSSFLGSGFGVATCLLKF